MDGTGSSRRGFLGMAATGAASGWALGGMDAAQAEEPGSPPLVSAPDTFLDTVNGLPNFCTHEHWGSITPIGMGDGGFRADTEPGAVPVGPVGVWDLFLDPYGGGWLGANGVDPHGLAVKAGHKDFAAWWAEAPEAALDAMRPHLARHRLTGVFQCTALGVRSLHGAEVASLALSDWQEADTQIRQAYADMFAWYREAMGRMHVSGLIRPVHPGFYLHGQDTPAAKAELAFTRTILRVDPLLNMWQDKSPQRDALAKDVGVDPVDAASWRDFIVKIMALAADNGTTGIKQLQAYGRSLDFAPRSDSEVRFRGDLDDGERRAFEDWVMHECCKHAHVRRWPFQCHVGTNNLSQSSPLPLEALARQYPGMSLVLLHCWPFVSESAHLAKQLPNVHLDPCWQPILNPEFLRRSLREWLGYVPSNKIMLSHDATSIEMAAGSSVIMRSLLAETLWEQSRSLGLGEDDLAVLAAELLHNNAVRLYGTGGTV
ncbi:MAG: hypothetical protein GX580_00485 [Candidatus Hydrogenedens sp.]|nr:hypothetical protein [Candidatus Hydrogenedentota bacterium]NLF56097.1 hypothetical protein [Candidatus Hydrogenedens sp.]